MVSVKLKSTDELNVMRESGRLQSGDIINVDITLEKGGFYFRWLRGADAQN